MSNKVNINDGLTVKKAAIEAGVMINSTYLFSLQPYIEGGNLKGALSLSNGAKGNYTCETIDDVNAPYGKVIKFPTGSQTFLAGYDIDIPVNAGDRLYAEVTYMIPADDAGTESRFYLGFNGFDKDKKVISGNFGLWKYVVSNITLTADGNWHTVGGYAVVPSSHTPYNGSDGGAVRYMKNYVLVNYGAGDREVYISNLIVRKVEAYEDSADVSFKGDVGIGTDDPSARLHVQNEEDGVSDAIKITSANAVYSHTFSPDVTGYNFEIDTVVDLRLNANRGTTVRGANASWIIGSSHSSDTTWDILPAFLGRNGSGNGNGNSASIYAGYAGNFGFYTYGSTEKANIMSFDRTDNENFGVNLLYANDSVTDGTKVEYIGLNLNKDGNVGIGLTNQEAKLHVVPESNGSGIIVERFEGGNIFEVKDVGDAGVLTVGRSNLSGRKIVIDGGVSNAQVGFSTYDSTGTEKMRLSDTFGSFIPNDLKIGESNAVVDARLQIVGSGNTSSTTALLVENSDGDESFKVNDIGNTYIGGFLYPSDYIINNGGGDLQIANDGVIKFGVEGGGQANSLTILGSGQVIFNKYDTSTGNFDNNPDRVLGVDSTGNVVAKAIDLQYIMDNGASYSNFSTGENLNINTSGTIQINSIDNTTINGTNNVFINSPSGDITLDPGTDKKVKLQGETQIIGGPLVLSTWTTANRPSPVSVGTIGYNLTTLKFEGYTTIGWVDFH